MGEWDVCVCVCVLGGGGVGLLMVWPGIGTEMKQGGFTGCGQSWGRNEGVGAIGGALWACLRRML